MKKVIIILFLLGLSLCLSAQCDMSAGTFGNYEKDNYIEVRLTASQEGEWYVCKIDLLRPGYWYNGKIRPTGPPVVVEDQLANYPQGLDIYFDVNPDHIDESTLTVEYDQSYSSVGLGLASFGWDYSREEWGIRVINTFGLADQRTSVGDFYVKLTRSDYDNTAAKYIALTNEGQYYPYATIKWKLPASASGEVGLIGRGCGMQYSSYPTEIWGKPVKAWHPSSVANMRGGDMGFCYSGTGLIEVGGAPVSPEITTLASSDPACAGLEQVFTATVKGEYDNITWTLEDAAGNEVGASVGSVSSTVKGQVKITWTANAAGAYKLCGVPKLAGAPDGVKYYQPITVYEVPTISLAYDNSKTCAGETVVLTPQITKSGTSTNVTNELKGFSWTIGTNPASQAATLTYSVALPATQTAYHFNAVTNDAGACPVKASIDLQGGAAPAIVDASIKKKLPLLGTEMTGNKYYKGDVIELSVENNPNHSYEWKLGSTSVSTTNSYTITSATESSYVGSVKVADKATNCSATANFNISQDNSCGVIASVTDLNGNASATICTNGVALLKAKATLTCPGVSSGNFVLSYAWYKKDGGNWVRQDSVSTVEKNENVFAAQSAGDYQVRVYTNRGMSTAQITVTQSGSIPLDDVVKTETPLTVPYGSTTVLVANSAVAQSYLWMPENMFADGANKVQYPETKSIEQETQFKVYATHPDGCVSMGITDVKIGDNGLKVTAEVIGNPVCDYGKARMIAHVDPGSGSGHYSYQWTEDTRSFRYSTTEQEAVIDVSEDKTTSLTRIVVVTDQITGNKGIGSVQVNVFNLKGPELKFEGIAAVGNLVCQTQTVKVVNSNATAIASYDWYIKNNTTNEYTTKMNAGSEYTFNDRGDYTVWVAAKTNAASYCYSDTVNTKTPVSVKGFDLAWTETPASAYMSGQTLKAAVEATSEVSSTYTFTWESPAGGIQSSTTQNPNEYKLEGAYLPEYWFKVKAIDNNKCERSDSIKVSKNDLNDDGLLLTLAAKEVNYCNGGSAVMNATVSGGSGPYNFTWYKEGHEATPLQGPVQVAPSEGKALNKFISDEIFSVDTKIIVKVTDASTPNQLIRRDTVLVKKVNTPAPKISAGVDRMIAHGTSTYLLGTVISGNPTSWTWADANDLTTNGINTPNPLTKPLSKETTFTVYAVDNNGCTSPLDEVKISVTAPGYDLAVNINEPALLCSGSIVTLDADVTPAGKEIDTWQWGATLGSISNKAEENPQLTINSVSANTKMNLLVMVTDKNGVTAVDRATDIIVQNTVAPQLKLTGYTTGGSGDYLCSNETQLTVAATDPTVTLGACTWYVNDTEVTNADGSAYTKATYKHTVENSAYLTFKVSAVSLAGCPASNTIVKSIQAYPQPKLEWDASSTSSPVKPGDPVAVTATLAKTTSANYKYVWKHDGPAQTTAPAYNDEGTTPTTATTVTSRVTTNAAEETSPYYFQVTVEDKYGCHSEQISKTITLDGDALFVTLASKYGDYCDGGDAVLRATTVTDIDEGNLEYTWYKDNIVIPGVKGKELIVKNSEVGSAYYVEVKATDGSGKTGTTVATPLTLTGKADKAPVLTGVDQKIPKNTKTALIVLTDDALDSLKWMPEDKLAANESTLRSPYTVILNTPEQKYTVYGVDANKCVGSAEVTVETINVETPAGADNELFVKVIPSPDTICKGNRLGIHTEVWASASDSPVYEWLPNDGNLSAYDVADPVFNPAGASLASKTYSYTVKVRQGALLAAARADIVVVDGVLPNLVLDADNSGKYCAGSNLVVKVQNGVPVKKYTWIINGRVDETITGNTYTWPAVLKDTPYSVRVIAESDKHCRSLDSVRVDQVISPALKLNPLQVLDSCGQVKIFSDAGSNADYNWTLTSGSTFLKKEEGVTKDTLYLKQNTPGFTAASIEYGVKLTVTPKSGGCASEGSVSSKVYFKPKVQLEKWTPAGETVGLPYRVIEKGASVQQRVADRNYDDAVNSKTVWSPTEVKGSPTAAVWNNVQRDDSIIVIVTNKELETCMASDTMPVYLYPEAPKVEIDTNTCLTDIAIKWESLVADSVRVWGILEDAYDVLGNGYEMLASVNMSDKKWIEPNMNERLKFYYLQSVKSIQGRVFAAKVVSDTVGWLKQTIYGVNPNAGASSSNNLIAYPFDMSGKGIVTDRDLYHKLLDKRISYQAGKIGYWDFSSQTWTTDNYIAIGPTKLWTGAPVNLATGNAYWLVVSNIVPNTELLLYGKLNRFSYNFELNPAPGMASASYILYPLSMIDNRKRQSLGMSIPSYTLGGYEYSTQIYSNANRIQIGAAWMWSPAEATDKVLLEGWLPIRVVAREKVVNWKK